MLKRQTYTQELFPHKHNFKQLGSIRNQFPPAIMMHGSFDNIMVALSKRTIPGIVIIEIIPDRK